jgi:hypothetical protein
MPQATVMRVVRSGIDEDEKYDYLNVETDDIFHYRYRLHHHDFESFGMWEQLQRGSTVAFEEDDEGEPVPDTLVLIRLWPAEHGSTTGMEIVLDQRLEAVVAMFDESGTRVLVADGTRGWVFQVDEEHADQWDRLEAGVTVAFETDYEGAVVHGTLEFVRRRSEQSVTRARSVAHSGYEFPDEPVACTKLPCGANEMSEIAQPRRPAPPELVKGRTIEAAPLRNRYYLMMRRGRHEQLRALPVVNCDPARHLNLDGYDPSSFQAPPWIDTGYLSFFECTEMTRPILREAVEALSGNRLLWVLIPKSCPLGHLDDISVRQQPDVPLGLLSTGGVTVNLRPGLRRFLAEDLFFGPYPPGCIAIATDTKDDTWTMLGFLNTEDRIEWVLNHGQPISSTASLFDQLSLGEYLGFWLEHRQWPS